MEFTWLKTCAARKYTFFRAHFWSPGTAYLKYTCPNVYFWCFDVVYFLHMFGAFAMRFLLKSVFFYAFGTCVSPRRIFFTPWAPASCAGVFILRVCENRTCTFTASVFSYPHIVHFFWKVHFWTAPVETKITFLLQVYFGSTCFPKVKRTFNCFKIVRVSTGFGEFNLSKLDVINPRSAWVISIYITCSSKWITINYICQGLQAHSMLIFHAVRETPSVANTRVLGIKWALRCSSQCCFHCGQ